jgi:hypothetical protein
MDASTSTVGAPAGTAHAAGGGTGAPGAAVGRVPVPPSHHGHDCVRWPLRDSVTLRALPGAVPSARTHVRQVLREWAPHQADLGQDVSVVISELVSNGVTASAGLRPAVAPVLVWLGADTRHLLIAVGDASDRPPVRLPLVPDADGGRGLALVEALSTRWGWHPTGRAGLAKIVWAEWRVRSWRD